MAQSIPPRAIMVVEDEPFIRYDLVDFFEDHGFQVFEAGDAEKAIQMLEANPAIRIVFTDVQMPGSMDGLMLAHYVRKRYPPTILILASGQGVPGDLPERAMFLHKPFDPRRVIREINRLAAQ